MPPTRSEIFAKLIEHLRLAQEDAANMAHLENAQNLHGSESAKAWLQISENLKQTQYLVTDLARRGMQ